MYKTQLDLQRASNQNVQPKSLHIGQPLPTCTFAGRAIPFSRTVVDVAPRLPHRRPSPCGAHTPSSLQCVALGSMRRRFAMGGQSETNAESAKGVAATTVYIVAQLGRNVFYRHCEPCQYTSAPYRPTVKSQELLQNIDLLLSVEDGQALEPNVKAKVLWMEITHFAETHKNTEINHLPTCAGV